MENKQTAVEWLFEKLWDMPKDKFNWYAIMAKAKAMEREQIEDMVDKEKLKQMNTEAKDTTPIQLLCEGLNKSAQIIFQNNKEKGFWDKERNVGELLMLITSELGEAMEAHRKGRFAQVKNFDEALSKSRIINQDPTYTGTITPERAYAAHFQSWMKDTFEDEIADVIIRLLDLSAGLGIDLEKHINSKVRYNKDRPKLHGKLY